MIIKRGMILILFWVNFLIAQNNKTDSSLTQSIEFSFTGDIMCHSTQFKFAKVGEDTFDFKPVYREIKPYLDNSDVVVGNLETVIQVDSLKYSGYPVFNTPEDFLDGLKYAGFDILSTANNHAFDIRERGIKSTIEYLQKYGFQNVGTYLSEKERDSAVVFEKNGIKFSILSYTYGVNLYKIPEEESYLVNRINSNLIKNDIERRRENGAELIILFFHFGTEYQRQANNYQKDVVNRAIADGADIVIGSHPHTLQQVEYFKNENGNLDSGFVAYSLGNFISNQRWRYSDGGAVLNFTIQKRANSSKLHLSAVRYLPFWVYKGLTKNGMEYVILPSEIVFSDSTKEYLSDADIELMKECYEDSKAIINNSGLEIDNLKRSNLRKLKREYYENIFFISKLNIAGIDKNELKKITEPLELLEEKYKKILPIFE